MIKEITLQNKNTYLFVEIPNDAYDFKDTSANGVMYKLLDGYQDSIYFDEIDENLKFKIISATKDITESQAENIIEQKGTTPWFKNYIKGLANMNWFEFKTAKKSLQSLIQSIGLDVEKNYLILLKNN